MGYVFKLAFGCNVIIVSGLCFADFSLLLCTITSYIVVEIGIFRSACDRCRTIHSTMCVFYTLQIGVAC